jgi:hypothetical protein
MSTKPDSLDTHISLAHGNGGRFMRELIEQVFARHLSNPLLDLQSDAVALPIDGGEIAAAANAGRSGRSPVSLTTHRVRT